MIRSEALEEHMRQQRSQAKTLDNLFRRRIEAGANCAPFVSAAIMQTAKEVFPLEPDATDSCPEPNSDRICNQIKTVWIPAW
jgi:hypothetical protein